MAQFARAEEQEEEEDEDDLRDIDKKDVVPPGKYKGDVSTWRHWYMKLATFLARRDVRWSKLLDAIRDKSKNPLDDKKEAEIFEAINVRSEALKAKFKVQLYEYLESYTEGLIHSMVISGGTRASLEAFRQLCDESFSARARNLRKEYRKVSHPRQATFETLKKAILD